MIFTKTLWKRSWKHIAKCRFNCKSAITVEETSWCIVYCCRSNNFLSDCHSSCLHSLAPFQAIWGLSRYMYTSAPYDIMILFLVFACPSARTQRSLTGVGGESLWSFFSHIHRISAILQWQPMQWSRIVCKDFYVLQWCLPSIHMFTGIRTYVGTVDCFDQPQHHWPFKAKISAGE